MADLDIAIAGRSYRVACADGEEENLTEAARLVDIEASSLRDQFGARFGQLSETRVLLMASLMLGDRFRLHLAEEGQAPEPEPEADSPAQTGFFDDPALTARVAELEAALAASQESEAAAMAALEEAAERIRGLAGEIAEGDLEEELDGDLDDDLEGDLEGDLQEALDPDAPDEALGGPLTEELSDEGAPAEDELDEETGAEGSLDDDKDASGPLDARV